MLPSRLFRNTGIPPALRSLVIPRFPAALVLPHLRLGARANVLQSAQRLARYSTPASAHFSPTSDGGEPTADVQTTTSQALPEKMAAPRLSMTFTCTADECGERSTHEFSRQAYKTGIVLAQCPKCHVRHLIADHIGWFKESTEDGKLRTVEDLLRARGETVTRGTLGSDGVVEYAPTS
ncbi:DNL zinc finger-domain-containing protein [Mycena pura]|uniref:DNL zinc finger-domain-containing protein n=1 Tax=Mycena pura TaxID=153505 RepID=A0AAD6YVZ8_9AGAR|nr:DNL zinc finger-domain-containing protein [Mycena pura]